MRNLITSALLLLAEGDLSVKERMMYWVAEYSYVGVFLFLIACGLGFPAPEEIALIGGGYAIYLDDPNSWSKAWLMVLVAMVGVIVGDSILWWIGRRVGENPGKVPLIGRHLTPQRMRRARAMFRKHGAKAVFFGRFLFGIRAVTFFVSGSLRVPLTTFVIMDGLAALLTVPASILLAWHFGGELEQAAAWIGRVDGVVLGFAVVAGAVFVILFLRRRKRLLAAVDAEYVKVESESDIAAYRAPKDAGADSESESKAQAEPPSDQAEGTREAAAQVASGESSAGAAESEASSLLE